MPGCGVTPSRGLTAMVREPSNTRRQ